MVDLIETIVEEIQDTTKHNILIKGNSSQKVIAYKPQITEVITNLLTNAIKYSPGKKKIIVNVSNTTTHVSVSVQDFGIGISKKSLKLLFDRFYRTPISLEKKIPGIGLGLYISKKIIDSHKGKLSVKSILGKGSTFTFTIPLENV